MRKILAACGLLLLASVQIASAQSINLVKVASCGTANYNVPYLTVDATGTLCTAASASISGFAPATTGTPISVTTGGVTGSLPAGTVVVATNVGTTNGAYCKLGASSTTSDQYIAPNGGWFAFTVGANTQLTCITSTSTTTVNMVGGSGLPTGTGGGGGGSSGGGTSSSFDAAFPATGTAIGLSDGTNMKSWLTALIQTKTAVNGNNMGSVATWLWNGASFDAATGTAALGANVQAKSGAFASGSVASGAMVDLGAQADSVCGSATGTCSMIALAKYLNNAVTSPIPAGTNVIGKVGIDQTTPGTTNGVQDAATSATGSAVPAKAIYTGVIDAVGGNLAGLTGDPCQTSVKSSLPITLATAAVKVIAAGVSAKKIYVCAIDLTNNAADSVAVFEATTGTTCATAAVAVVGAGTSVATAATGYNFAANGGISKGNGGFQVMQTTVNNNDLCIAQSAATQLTGNITYVTR